MYYLIYKTTNIINNKFYIGMHKTNNIDDGYLGSGKYLLYAIKKHGIENFKREILFQFDNEEEMRNKEKEIVTEEFLEENKGKIYNILVGGKGGFYFINKNGLHNYFDTTNAVKRCKELLQDKNSEWSKKRSINLSKSRKEFYKTEKGNIIKNNKYFLGRKHTKESIEKMKISNSIDKKYGNKNSQYNTCWIYNIELKQNKKIKKENLEVWLKQGWIKGRKFIFKDT